MNSLTYIQLLKSNQSFRRLWLGQVVSEMGNWFNLIATLGLVRLVSNKAASATTIILIARLLPFTLFSPLAGAFVDRWSRRTVMIATDLARAGVALSILFVHRGEDLWLAYLCTALLSFFGTFFEAAKNAAVPNITGDRDLLVGNALMFSSRFLLMSLGAALGGWTAAHLGYQAAFIVNSASFLVSAYSLWLIPDSETRQDSRHTRPEAERSSYWSDIREGWTFIISQAPVATLLGINVLWATGGGAINLIVDRLGGLVFAGQRGISGDSAVALLYCASGLGLTIGMLIARRAGAIVELRGKLVAFIGWMLVVQGLVFALIGAMPTLILACLALFFSRLLLGVEFAVQDTLLVRLTPDKLRGRVITTDRATELLVWNFSTAAAGWSLRLISPQKLTVVSGLLSASSGAVWLALFALRRVRLPEGSVAERRIAKPEAVSVLAD